MKKIITLVLSALFIYILAIPAFSQDTCKIMTYNLLNYSGQVAKEINFRKSMKYADPDILVIEELISETAMNRFVTEVLNYYTPGVYAAGTYINSFDTDNAVFYKQSKFNFISNIAIHTDLRDINMFTLVHIQSHDTIRLFAVHLKASSGSSNEQQRLVEVNFMRAVTNAFPLGTEFMVMGDFNIYNADEPAYIRMLQMEPGNEGHFIDPNTLPGVWNQAAYSQYHSQSTRTRSLGDGGATGGMDDRFDFILNSKALTEEGRVKYIPGTMKPFGNDGDHYNDSINKRPNTSVPDSVADALSYGSDHLPVSALYKFETHPNAISNSGTNTPASFTLYQNYPNPFNPSTTITYQLKFSSFINIKIFDARGSEIKSLINQKQSPGNYMIKWDASGFPSGNYFYKLTAGEYSETKSMILVK